jgi:glycosyltransferase involved in cell wall biosynthesis
VAGKTGLLYAYGDYHQLAEQIIELIRNVNLRKSLARECINWAHQFDWEDSVTNMLNLIEKVLSRR